MKKLLLVLLLTVNVFAVSESKTDAAMDSICLHKGTVEKMAEIDEIIKSADPIIKEDKTNSIAR